MPDSMVSVPHDVVSLMDRCMAAVAVAVVLCLDPGWAAHLCFPLQVLHSLVEIHEFDANVFHVARATRRLLGVEAAYALKSFHVKLTGPGLPSTNR